MNYPKIDLKTIRQESKHFQADTPRLFLLYILPSMLVILSGFLNPLSRIHGTVLEQPFFSILGQILQTYLFPLLVSFIGTILLTSSVYATLTLMKDSKTEPSVKNSLALFDEERFSQTFLTLLLKRFYLFLWSIPNLLGIYLLFYSSFLAKKFVTLHPEFPNLDLSSVETERFLMVFGLYFLASLILIIVGNILYIPQYYAYSQVEFLLCYSLDLGQVPPRRILKTSRSFMKSYKFQHFVLDLQLLPWYFLNWITFGIASFSLLPYIQCTKIMFYRAVLARKRPKA
ncbi:putative integral membrane protein [Streptococcus pneumoniae]|nr:putative integral membrane protein [Streptococcus pneumoniae]